MQVGTGDAEEFVHAVNNGEAFGLVEFAFGIAQGLELEASLEAGVVIFLVTQGFAADARQGGQQPVKARRQILEAGGKRRGLETLKEFENAHDSELEADLMQFGALGF